MLEFHISESEQSLEIRTKLIGAYKSGSGHDPISEWYTIPKSIIQNVFFEFKKEKTVANKHGNCRKKKLSIRSESNFLRSMENNPNITIVNNNLNVS